MKKKKMLISLLTAICITAISAGFIYIGNVFASENDAVRFEEVVFEDGYALGSELPIQKVAEVIDGKTINADIRIKYPDGNTYGYNEIISLTQAGLYSVDYIFADDNEIKRRESKSFKVYESIFSFGSDSSSAVYDNTLERPGLFVKLAANDTMYFNNIVDLTGFTSWDNLISYYVLTAKPATFEFMDFYLNITDIYDESNVVTIDVNAISGNDWLYGLAASAGNKLKGTGYFGTGFLGGSFRGTKDSLLKYSIEMSTGEVFVNDTMVIDLNSPEYFTKPWVGFTDGKVKLSLTIGGNTTSHATFVLREVAGSVLTEQYVTNALKPTIVINEEEVVEKGVIGGECKIPTATAYIGNNNYEVSTMVFYNYYDEAKKVNVDCIGESFIPTKKGIYTIEYKSYNSFGDYELALVDVYVEETLPVATLSVSTQDAITSGYRGSLISVAPYNITTPDGIQATCTIVAEHNGNSSLVDNGTFLAEESGEYVVRYTLIDNVGRKQEETYLVNIVESQYPVIGKTPDLPEYYFGGYDYVFPTVEAYNYATNQKVTANLRYKIDNGEYKDVSIGEKVEINCQNATGTLFLEYYVKNGNSVVSSIIFERPIIKVYTDSKIDMAAYFSLTDGISVTKNEDHFAFEATNDGKVRFLKNQASRDFNFALSLDSKKASFSQIVVYLTDSIDKTQKVAIRFTNKDREAFFVSFGETGNYLTDYNKNMLFAYSVSDNTFLMNGVVYEARNTVEGKQFTGFASGLVDFEFEFIGVNTTACVKLGNFNGQTLNNYITGDYILPKIILTGELGGKYAIGSRVKVSNAFASDIFDPTVKLLATVTDPNGNIIKSDNGILLSEIDPNDDYYFILDKVGVYNIKYFVKGKYDFRVNEINGRVTSQDKIIEPELTLYGDMIKTAKLGDVISIPEAKAYDVDGSELTVIRMLITPTLDGVYLNSDYDSFVANRTGTYTLVYYAINSSGGSVCVRFVLEVE